MESLLEAEVPCTAGIDLSSTTDRHEGRCDVRLDEPVGRAILVFLCVKMFQGVFISSVKFMSFNMFGTCRGFRKVREVCTKNFHLAAPPKTVMVPSYDHKAKKVNE